jgi:hypothetical protein
VGGEAIVTEWMESPHSLAEVIRTGSQEERDRYGELLARFLFVGPRAPGCCTPILTPATSVPCPGLEASPDGSASSTSARSPACRTATSPRRWAADPDRRRSRPGHLVAGLREEGFIKDNVKVDPQLVLDYLAPFVEPAREHEFRFTRAWMREQFERINIRATPPSPWPPSSTCRRPYLLIHRTWLGGLGLLSQLEAKAGFPRDYGGAPAGLRGQLTPASAPQHPRLRGCWRAVRFVAPFVVAGQRAISDPEAAVSCRPSRRTAAVGRRRRSPR